MQEENSRIHKEHQELVDKLGEAIKEKDVLVKSKEELMERLVLQQEHNNQHAEVIKSIEEFIGNELKTQREELAKVHLQQEQTFCRLLESSTANFKQDQLQHWQNQQIQLQELNNSVNRVWSVLETLQNQQKLLVESIRSLQMDLKDKHIEMVNLLKITGENQQWESVCSTLAKIYDQNVQFLSWITGTLHGQLQQPERSRNIYFLTP